MTMTNATTKPKTTATKAKAGTKLSSEALSVLSGVTVAPRGNGALVTLGSGQLSRTLYVEVDKALQALGGAWDRKAKGHVFESDPSDALDGVVFSGAFNDEAKEADFFPTPRALAMRVAFVAAKLGIAGTRFEEETVRVLEPSAGRGALAQALIDQLPNVQVDAVELLAVNRVHFPCGKGSLRLLDEVDFLQIAKPAEEDLYDLVLMNPPFSGTKGLDHVEHAASFLREGGSLVAILPVSITCRTTKRFVAFREFLARHHADITPLPDGSFKESGTMVRTVLVRFTMGAA